MVALHARQLTLLLPGLFGPGGGPGAAKSEVDPAHEATILTNGLELPRLTRVLSRARLAATDYLGQSLEALYFKTFEYSLAADEDLPAAALTAAIDGLDPGDGVWLRADPVHLQPDLGRLILRDSRDLNLQADEARQLATELNAEIRELELELQIASPTRWYVRLGKRPRFTSMSPASAHGQDADSCLLRGEDARHWHQIQNQIQMLLHNSEVNTAREAAGRLAVNSLWFWGCGALPPGPARCWSQVYADDHLITALARHSGSPYMNLATTAQSWLEDMPAGSCLLVVSAAARATHDQDRFAWQQALDEIEQRWLGPVYQALLDKKLDLLTVDGGGHWRFVIDARDARKWWRRDQSLASLFHKARKIRP